MGNQNSTGENDLKDWAQDEVARRVTICEVTFAAEEEREQRIENGRPDIYEVDLALQSVFEQIKSKKQVTVCKQQFSKVMNALVEKKSPFVSKKRSITPSDKSIVSEHHIWFKRQKSYHLTEQERVRQLSTQMHRQSSTVDNYQRVVSNIRIIEPNTHQPSLIMKKQQLNAMVKTHQRSTMRRQQCTKPTHMLAANDKACIADLLHDLRSNHPVLKTVQKRVEVSSATASSTVEDTEPAIPKVLSAFSAKYASYNPVLSALVNRATTAGLKAADIENTVRSHNDHLSAVNSEFTRMINKQTALREMEAEKGARVASDKFRDVMHELTHVYNAIIVDHMRAVEQESQINKDRFREVCHQLLRKVHQSTAKKSMAEELEQRITQNRFRHVLQDLTRRAHQREAISNMTAERERRVTVDRFRHVMQDLTRFCNAVMADCVADQEKSRRISEPPSARKIFSKDRMSLLRAVERKANQRQALKMMRQEQQRRVKSPRINKTSDVIFMKQHLHKELEQVMGAA